MASIDTVTVGVVLDTEKFNELVEAAINRLQGAQEQGRLQRAREQDALPIVGAVASAGLLLAGSQRQTSRRNFLGLGWLRKER